MRWNRAFLRNLYNGRGSYFIPVIFYWKFKNCIDCFSQDFFIFAVTLLVDTKLITWVSIKILFHEEWFIIDFKHKFIPYLIYNFFNYKFTNQKKVVYLNFFISIIIISSKKQRTPMVMGMHRVSKYRRSKYFKKITKNLAKVFK